MLLVTIILSILLIVLLIALRNLLVKVEKYEDITVDQTNYLQNISDLIKDSQKHLQSLDERGVFQSDDEVGYFFEQMKSVQKELDRYMLPENYGKKKSES
jgi:type II secretory pathway pseudopilin PulG